MQKIDALKAVSRNLGDLIVDAVASAATPTTIDAGKLIHPQAEALRGKEFYIYSGAGAGQQRTVGSYSPTNNRLIFAQTFVSTPSHNSAFLMFGHFGKDDYDNALDRMIGLSELKYLEEKVGTAQIVGTQYEYPVPSGYEYINTIRLVPSASDTSDYESSDEVSRMFEFPPRYWRIEVNPLGTYVVAFDRRKIDLDVFDGEWIRIMGQVKPSVSATDTGTIPTDIEEYVIAGASMIMASQRISENQEWQRKFYMFRDMTRELEAYVYRNGRGKRVG